jgi:competence protein ComEA
MVALLFAACAREENVNRAQQGKPPHSACVDLNRATAEELMRLPGIGPAFAQKIIEYRTLYGPFRRPEEVIIIQGFSERKYRAIAALICVQ